MPDLEGGARLSRQVVDEERADTGGTCFRCPRPGDNRMSIRHPGSIVANGQEQPGVLLQQIDGNRSRRPSGRGVAMGVG